MSDLIDIAHGVCSELNSYNATLQFNPEYTLGELEQLKIIVVPIDTQFRRISRVNLEETHKVQIGILQRITNDNIDELVTLSEDLAKTFLAKNVNNLPCLNVEFMPIYSHDKLRESNQFTSVIELTFKQVK